MFDLENCLRKASRPLAMISISGLFLVVLFSISSPGFAQHEPFLLLEKPGTKHRIRFYAGDPITLVLRDEPGKFNKTLERFGDDRIFIFNGPPIVLNNIEAVVDPSKVASVRSLSKVAFKTIPVFFVFSAANNIFNTGRSPVIDPEVWTISAVFAAIGLAGYLYNGRRYRLDNRWRLIVVHH